MVFYESETFEPETSIGYQIKRVQQAMAAALEPAFAAEGLTHAQWSVLVSLYFERGRTCAELARDQVHDKGAMTRIIDVMEQKGWVTRERAQDDRRHVILALTPEGEALAERTRSQVAACWNGWLTGWASDDVRRLINDLKLLRTAIAAQGSCA